MTIRSIRNRKSERGNVFFTLFGAVAIVGVLGAGIMATMRGPLSTMVNVNRRTQAEADMNIASKMVLLEATQDPVDAGDCDLDGFVEPMPYADPAGGDAPVGGGYLPTSVGSNKVDPWGTNYGYCAWDPGNETDADDCNGENRLAGNGDGIGDANPDRYTIIAIISAGPDQEFDTTCAGGASPGVSKTAGSDDMWSTFSYETASAMGGGLWSIKQGFPDVAVIDKDIEAQGATFTGPVDMSAAASMFLPNETVATTCNGANIGIVRVNTTTDPDTLEVCDGGPAGAGPFTWQSVAAGAAALTLWQQHATDTEKIFYDVLNGKVGIGVDDPTESLDVDGNVKLTEDLLLATGSGIIWGATGAHLSEGTSVLELGYGASEINIAAAGLALTGNTTITGSGATDATNALVVSNSTPTPILIVENDGQVGIGVADPNDKLDVSGSIDLTDGYKIDGNAVLKSDTTVSSTILLGYGAGDSVTTGNYNTILGGSAGATLVSGKNNILIGSHDVTAIDVPLLDTDNYLNIGNLIFGDLANGRVGIGTDTLDDALEVAGAIDATGNINSDASIIAATNITATAGNIVATAGNIVATAGNIEGGDILARGTVHADVYELEGLAQDFSDIPPCDDANDKVIWIAGTGWDCATDLQGGAGGAGQNLEEVLTVGDDAGGLDAVDFGGIAIGSGTLSTGGSQNLVLDATGAAGADFFCDSDGNNCFTAATIASGGTSKLSTITAADANNTIGSAAWNQIWNWQLTAAETGFAFGETAASTGGAGDQFILAARTLAASTATPFMITNLGAANSFRVNDETGDADATPFIITNTGNVGIGDPSPAAPLTVGTGDLFQVSATGHITMASSNQTEMRFTGVDAANISGETNLYLLSGTTGSGTIYFGSNNVNAQMALVGGEFGIGDTTPDDGTGGGGQNLLLDVNGATGSTYFCDENGLNCFTAASVAGTGLWEKSGTVIRIRAPGVYATDDFVFGAAQLANVVGTDEDNRIFFDKSKAAFRAGGVTGAEWDDANVGSFSTAVGDRTTASGLASFASGIDNIASGSYSSVLGGSSLASGPYSFAAGGGVTAAGSNSFAVGSAAWALGNYSAAFGLGFTAGTYPQVSGTNSMGIFMGDQDAVDVTATNLMALLGGRMVIDPDTTSAANTNVSTGVQQLELDVQGDIGAVNFCDEAGNNCFTPASVASNRALSAITAATAGNSINNADYAQAWNWNLTTADKDAFTFTENTASSATGHSSILKAATLATSTATPLRVTNLGTADSFVVNDETGDADATPFLIDASGNVGIGTASPTLNLEILGGATTTSQVKNTNYAIQSRVADGGGAYLEFGIPAGPSSLMILSSAGGINSINTRARDFQIYSTAIATGLTFKHDTGNVGIGTTSPASLFVVASPTAEVVGAAATITANSCGTVKQVSATANRTTNTTDTFTQPTASYNGCCMDVVNIDTVDTITLDANARFITGPGTDLTLGPGKAVRVCSDGTSWYQAASITSVASGGNIPLSGLTAAIADNAINSGDWNQTWNWQLVGAETGLVVGENVASTGGTIGASGNQFIMKASTLATSTATPLIVTNLGTANSFRVNDATGDTDTTPFVVDEAGEVGIGTATPGVQLQIHQPTGAFPKMRLTAADVTTAVTSGSASVGDVSATNTIGQIRNRMDGGGVHTGGMLIQGFTGSGVNNHYPLHLMGMHGGTAPTTAAVTIGAQKWSGTNNRSALDGTTPILDIENNYSTAASGGLVMRIMGDGKVGIGTATPGDILNIAGELDDTGLLVESFIDSSSSGNVTFRHARGTEGSETIVQNNDEVGHLLFQAHDGTNYENAASIVAAVDGTPGNNDMPGRLDFYTALDGAAGHSLRMTIKNNGAVGIGTTSPASLFVVAAPATEVIGAAATITANACGTVKRLSATANRTTDTTDTFTTPTASYAGCCMDVVNVDTVDTITLDQNANFITGPGTDLAVGPGKAVRVCSDGTSWYQASTVTSAAATILAIDDLSDAFTDYAVENNLIMGRAGAVALAAGAQRNTFIGQDAGATTADSTATTDSNTAVGYASLRSLTSGDQNTALGRNTLTNNLSGSYNVAVGNQALQQNTIGNGNTAVGSVALYSNVAKRESTAIGYGAMFYADDTAVSAVTYNTAVGAYALEGSTTPANNTGTGNTALGHSALTDNTSGGGNTALGTSALSSNTSGNNNVAIGYESLLANGIGSWNIGIGGSALANNDNGTTNIGIGVNSGLFIESGTENVAIGTEAMRGVTGARLSTGGNTAIGHQAGYAVQGTAANNTFLGHSAGSTTTTGSSNIVIGAGATAPATTTSNHLNIGGTIFGDLSTDNVRVGGSGLVGAGPFIAAPPTTEVVAAAAVITANACGTVKQISATANRTTDTTDTFTAPTASYAGCCMDVVNVDTVDTITLDNNANFITGPGTDLTLGPGKAVRVCSDGTSWYQAASVTNVASGGNIPLSGLTAAIADNSINNGNWNQVWNWQLAAGEVGFTFGENTASAGGSADQYILAAKTLATSTATPFMITNLGAADSFRVNDETGDADTTPFIIKADGKVGIGTDSPDELLTMASDAEIGMSIQVSTSGNANWNPYFETNRSRGTVAAPTAVQSGDMLMDFVVRGHDGTAHRVGAMITAVVDGTPGANDMPTRLEFQTQADGAGGWLGDGGSTPEMVIKNTGNIGISKAAPAGRLHVVGAGDGGASPTLIVDNALATQESFIGLGSNGTLKWLIGMEDNDDGTTGANDFAIFDYDALTWRFVINKATGAVGIGNTSPASRFVVGSPTAEVIGAAATITANSCGTVKQISATANRTTDTTDTFTAPTASYNGCCMDVVNVDTVDTITLDQNAKFFTGPGTDLALGPGKAVRVCSDGTSWYQAASVTSVASGGNIPLSGLTAAIAANSINNADYAQTWNWQLTTNDKDAFTFTENTASTATGHSSILKAATLATSTATPLIVTNLGAANSFVVNDETGDADASPFIVKADGKVGIGTASPGVKLDINNDNTIMSAIKTGDALRVGAYGTTDNFLSMGPLRVGADVGSAIQAADVVAGTGQSLLLNPFGGNVGIGTTTPSQLLEVYGTNAYISLLSNGEGAVTSTAASANWWDNGGFNAARSRGTIAAPTAVQSGDSVLTMWGTAYDGDTWETPALMQYFVDGTPGDGDMPGRIEFQTQADGAAVNPEATTPELVIKNSGNIGVSIAAPSAKLHVSNADAADSFRVDDVAGDTSPFVIAADGNVGIGIANPDELLDIGADAEKGLSVQVSTSGDPNWNPYIQTKRSRGTMASPTAVQNGDMLLDFIISGHDGSNFRTAAMIEAVVDGAVTGGGAADMPTRLEFQVQADGAGGWLGDGASTPEMVIKSNGAVGIGTATPNAGAKLDVAGPIFLDGLNDGSTGDLFFGGGGWPYSIGVGWAGQDNTLRFNAVGTSGGTADFRNVMILDGKTNPFAFFQGSTKRLATGGDDSTPDAMLEVIKDSTSPLFMLSSAAANNGDLMIVDTNGNVGIGLTSPASKFVVASPTAEVIGAAATITANSCGTVKRISATADRTTDTTDTFTAPTASYAGCCMDVVNVDTVDTITLDSNAKFFTGPGTDVALGPGKGVRVCSDGTSWYQAGGVSSATSASNALSGITAATTDATIASGANNITWNWQLAGAEVGHTFGETAASAGGSADQYILAAKTLATSTATPFMITNLGAAASFRVNDETGDADASPFVIAADGKVGIGMTAPATALGVTGSITVTSGQLYVPAGTLTDLPITIGGDTDSGFYSPSDGVTYLVSNGTALYQFQADKFKINSATVQIQPGFGSAAAPTYAFDSDADLGWYRAAADEIGISTAGTEKIRVDASGDVGIGNTSPASRFVVSPPSSEVIAAAAVITGDACGTVKQISATANRTTNTTDTFTTPTASYNGCCMDVVNVDTVDTITLDQNARFFTGPGTDIALAPGQGVRVCSDGTSWYQAGGVSSATAGGGGTIDGLSDAYTDYTTLNNIIMGRASAAALTAGAQYNLFIGENAGATSANSTATTDLNVAVGHYALPALTSGSYNTALGALTLQANTTGFDNVAIGTLALNTNVTKGQTTAVGYRAMEFANSAAGGGITYNTAIGALALQGSAAAASNTGTENTALGHSTLMANTSGSDNVAIGKEALKANTTASDNTAIGESAMLANTTGAMNTAMGSNALYQNIGGSANVAVGDIALGSTTASGNTAVGFEAGYAGTANTSGTYNTFIGHQAQANANNYTNATALGNGAIVTASNMMMFGNSSVTTNVFNGNVGIGTATPATNLHVASNAETFLFVDSAATNQWLNPTILGRRSRGTLASPTIVADDDELFAIGSYAYDGNSYEVGGYIGFYTDGTPGNADMPTRITLFTAPDGSATSLPRMTVNNAGNVGIGTSDPTAPLHIKKATDDWSTALRVEGDGEPTFAIDTSSAFDYYNPLIMTSRSRGSRAAKTAVASGDSLFEISTSGYDGSNDRVAFYMAAVVDGTVTGGGAADMPTRLEFHVQADGAGGGLEGTTPDMVIKNNGNVGIAMASPSVKLDVTGDIEYTGTIADVSDIRLKKDIHPLSERGSMLHKLGLIDTYSFKMKDSEVDQVEFGVMAQEIEKIFPELVRTADDEMGTKSVNYTGLIAPMIEAGKELEAQNKAMKAEIEALKARQDEMKQAMNEITEDMKGLKVHTGYGIGKAEMSLLMILPALGTLGAAGLARRRFSKPRQ